MPGIIIQSSNFNGQSVQITFSPFSGGSINLGTQTIPYTYTTTNYEGNYSIYIPSSDKTCSLQVGTPPSPTPTSTITPTPTMTPTPSSTPSSLDPDAAAYLADIVVSGGTITPTIESAVDTLFTSLKSNSLYSKMIAMYPFIGATAASHAINATLNKTYDIIWNGGVSHDISGSTGNGTNGYGETNVSTSNFIDVDKSSYGMYINSGTTLGNNARHGVVQLSLWGLGFSEASWYRHGDASASSSLGLTGNTGMFLSIRTGNTESKLYHNGIEKFTKSDALTIATNATWWYFNLNNNAVRWSNSRLAFGYLANDLSYSEASTLSTIINTFQTSLGRNTY